MISAALNLILLIVGKVWPKKNAAQKVDEVDHAMLAAAADHKPAPERLRDGSF